MFFAYMYCVISIWIGDKFIMVMYIDILFVVKFKCKDIKK